MESLKNLTLFDDIFDGNTTACFYVDESLDAIMEMRNVTMHHVRNPTGITISSIMIALSLPFIFFGQRIFRFVAAISIATWVFYGCYRLLENSSNLSCDAQIAVSSVLALIIAITTGCLIKMALFIIGALAFASLTHLVFAGFPELNEIEDVPTIMNKSLIYWGSMLVSILFGGFLVKYNDKPFVEIATSAVGSFAFTYGLHGLTELTDADINHWVFFGTGVVVCLAGIYVQRRFRLKKKKDQKKKDEK